MAGDGGSRLLGGLSGRLVFATLQPGSQLQWRRSLEQRRQVSEYRDLLPRYRGLTDAFDILLKKGLIKRRNDPGY